MDRLASMRAFVAVADLEGFTPAARRLGLTPSTVTRAVASLESSLGIRLFERTTRSVVLTDAGARYVDRARRILDDVDEADAAAQSVRLRPQGRFVVSAPRSFGRMHVAPAFSDFLAEHEAVRGELLLEDRMVNLVDEGVDLAVRIGHLSDGTLVASRVGATRRVVVAAPAYLARAGTPARPEALADHDVVWCTALTPSAEWRFGAEGAQRVAFHASFTTNSVDAALVQVERGRGVTTALAYQVDEAVRSGRLRVVLAEFEPPAAPIQLVTTSRRNVAATVRTFTEFVRRRARWQFTSFD